MPNCPACNGRGGVNGEPRCRHCGDAGYVSDEKAAQIAKRLGERTPCPYCGGTGQRLVGGIGPNGPAGGPMSCGSCGGKGWITSGQINARARAEGRNAAAAYAMRWVLLVIVVMTVPVWAPAVSNFFKKQNEEVTAPPLVNVPASVLCALCGKDLDTANAVNVDGIGAVHPECQDAGVHKVMIDGWVAKYGQETFEVLDKYGFAIWANGSREDIDAGFESALAAVRLEREKTPPELPMDDNSVIDRLVRAQCAPYTTGVLDVTRCDNWVFVHCPCSEIEFNATFEKDMTVTWHVALEKTDAGWQVRGYTKGEPGEMQSQLEGWMPDLVGEGFDSWVTDWGI